MLLGGVVAASMIIAMQLPLLHQPATGRVSIAPVALSSGSLSPIAWPTMGSAALIIPSLGVTSSWHDAVVPIASLVKMMTAYVALQKLPLALGGSGPCLVVSAADVATYQEMNATGQSNIKVAVGESLCEIDLLDGLLVHSANNFAVMLATLVSGNVSSFVDQMNQTRLRFPPPSNRVAWRSA
jgi:D-alanyl-D-alanine carboxypeptidase (penicillin-binding protein 5/6)